MGIRTDVLPPLTHAGGLRETGEGLDWLIVAGQSDECKESEIWGFGSCKSCPSGTQSERHSRSCSPCPEFFAGADGLCERCKDGRRPNADRVSVAISGLQGAAFVLNGWLQPFGRRRVSSATRARLAPTASVAWTAS